MKYSGVEWIGEIPNNWALERLQWHLEEIKESNDPVKTKQVLSLTNKLGVIPYEEKGEHGNKAKENVSEYKIAYPNTIVANSMNILIGSVGKCEYFGCVSPVYYVFKPKKGENIDFLNYVFQVTQFQKELRRFANGILEIRLRVSSSDILKRYIAFPPKEEQQKIVNFLNQKTQEIDSLIRIENQQIEKLKEYKQAVITEAVTKGLNKNIAMKDSDIEWIGKIPTSWKITRLKYISKIRDGLVDPTDETFANYPHIGPGNIEKFTGRLMEYKLVKDEGLISGKYLFYENDIIYGKINPQLGKVTFPGFKGLCSADAYALTADNTIVETKYLLLWFLTRPFIDRTILESMRMGMPKINREDLMKLEIVIPPLDVQRNIIEQTEKASMVIDELLSIKQKKINQLEEYKKSLIYEFVTGKKEVF